MARRRSVIEKAPTAPVPASPAVCRWCRMARVEASPGKWDCVYSGCTEALGPPRTCEDCRREFETGRPGALWCWPCEQRQIAMAKRSAEGGAGPTGWLRDQIQDGADRRAQETK